MRLLAVLVLVAVCACVPASSASGPDARGVARGAVVALADAWNVAADVCLAAQPKETCAKVLLPARDALLAAASAVDVWDDAAQKNLPCLIFDVAEALKPFAQGQAFKDALALAQFYQCQRSDAGAP